MFNKLKITFILFFTYIYFTFICFSSEIIMDDETETFLTEIVDKIKESSGMSKKIEVYISSDIDPNAFATENGNIVINIGMIKLCENVKELIAVLAHEVGHISGHHIAVFMSNRSDFMSAGLVPMILGAVVSVVTMNPAPIMFGMGGAGHVYERLALKKLREKENMADSFSVEAVKKLKWDVLDGFVSIHEKISRQPEYMNVYTSTHPSSYDRISRFKEHALQSKKEKYPEESASIVKYYESKFQKIKLKLLAYTRPPQEILESAKDDYSLSIAYHRNHDYEKSLLHINKLLKDDLNNPYYTEIKVMNLINQSKLEEAVKVCEESIKFNKKLYCRDLALLAAHAISEIKSPQNDKIEYILKMLRRNLLKYPNDLSIINMMGKLYSKQNKQDKASLCAAEIAFFAKDSKLAEIHAKRALETSDPIAKRKAQDILQALKNENKN